MRNKTCIAACGTRPESDAVATPTATLGRGRRGLPLARNARNLEETFVAG